MVDSYIRRSEILPDTDKIKTDEDASEVHALKVVLDAAATISGTVGIDQTTPGTTNGVGIRQPDEVTLNIANGASQTTEEVDISLHTMFSVYVAAGTEGTHLQVMDVPVSGSAAVNAKDENAALKIVAFTAGETVDLPVGTCTLQRIKLKTCSAVAGTAQTQTGATTLILRMKA